MRLKILFFPAMLVLSLIVVLKYIRPEIVMLMDIRSGVAASESEMVGIQQEKGFMEGVNQKLSSSPQQMEAVESYLPEQKYEEKIIDSVNYLVSGANVALQGIQIDSVSADTQAGASATTPGATVFGSQPGVVAADSEIPALAPVAPTPLSVPVKITVAGEYEKIKGFLKDLRKMPRFNTVTGLSIKAQSAEPGAEDQVRSDLLSAEISADFGYLPLQAVGAYRAGLLTAPIDLAIMENIEAEAQNIPNLEKGATGRANPFLP